MCQRGMRQSSLDSTLFMFSSYDLAFLLQSLLLSCQVQANLIALAVRFLFLFGPSSERTLTHTRSCLEADHAAIIDWTLPFLAKVLQVLNAILNKGSK